MSEEPGPAGAGREPAWLTRLAASRPDFVLMAPFMAYLFLLPLNDWLPEAYMPVGIAIRGVGAMAVVWLLRRDLPPLGKAHWGTAIVVGVLAAVLWVQGQYIFNGVEVAGKSLGGRLFLFPGIPGADDPREGIPIWSWRLQAVLRITVACTTVPVVEEVFWRGFLLRALINWDRFEKVPLGTFTWVSFLGTSLLSTLEHPDNWGVSILCWFLYNGLMYWKKSILCLIITHGVTNLVLYLYVLYAAIHAGQTQAWLFW
jgi:hypothetical protein